jgi:hypothetical protein
MYLVAINLKKNEKKDKNLARKFHSMLIEG